VHPDPDHHPVAPALALKEAEMASTLNRDAGATSAAITEASRSAVNWAPILAGAVVAIATTMILLGVGSGLGFAAASPWPGAGPSATTFAIGAGIWLIVTQWLSSFMGGYITGRLRTKWTGVHTREVFFRDTAHGLLAWAVATVVVGAVALSTTIAAAGAASNAAATAVSTATDRSRRNCQASRPRQGSQGRRPELSGKPGRGTDRPFPAGCAKPRQHRSDIGSGKCRQGPQGIVGARLLYGAVDAHRRLHRQYCRGIWRAIARRTCVIEQSSPMRWPLSGTKIAPGDHRDEFKAARPAEIRWIDF
jgi:hypothetical protein